MKLLKKSNGKQTIKMSHKEWMDMGKKAGWMKNAQGTQVVQRGDGKVVLISDWVNQHIESHMKPGSGSVFVSLPNLEKGAQEAPIQGDGGLYPMSCDGYNLVLPIEQARLLPNAEETEVSKEERGQSIMVNAIKTSAPINNFKTNQANIVIRKTSPEYIPEDVKNNNIIIDALSRGEVYSVLTAFPGPDIPVASQWNGQWAVIITS